MPKTKKSSLKAKLSKTRHDLLQSCRLCGIIGGSRVPIIQETITIGDDTCIDESDEIQINKKIQDCLSIEVKYGDNLPPLICIICLDKLNDFYEFRIMCAETNIRLHKALGISIEEPQPVGMVVSTGEADNKLDYILGVDGPVFFQLPGLNTKKLVNKKIPPVKKENKMKYTALEDSDEDDKPLIKRVKIKNESVMPILEIKSPNKRERNRNRKLAILEKFLIKKKMTLAAKNKTIIGKNSVAKNINKKKLPYNCKVCSERFSSGNNLRFHQLESHVPKILQFGCIPCKEGFQSFEDFTKHNIWHKQNSVPYNCLKCSKLFRTYRVFLCHFDRNQCVAEFEVQDFTCNNCNNKFETKYLLLKHDCNEILLSQYCDKEFSKPSLAESHEKYCTISQTKSQIPRKAVRRYAKFINQSFVRTDVQSKSRVRDNLDIDCDDYSIIKTESIEDHGLFERHSFTKPSLKLKIKKEHGTLNSSIIEDFEYDNTLDPNSSINQKHSYPVSMDSKHSDNLNYMCEISSNISQENFNEISESDNLSSTLVIKTELSDSEDHVITEHLTSNIEDCSYKICSQISQSNTNTIPVITSAMSLGSLMTYIKPDPESNVLFRSNENEPLQNHCTSNSSLINVKSEPLYQDNSNLQKISSNNDQQNVLLVIPRPNTEVMLRAKSSTSSTESEAFPFSEIINKNTLEIETPMIMPKITTIQSLNQSYFERNFAYLKSELVEPRDYFDDSDLLNDSGVMLQNIKIEPNSEEGHSDLVFEIDAILMPSARSKQVIHNSSSLIKISDSGDIGNVNNDKQTNYDKLKKKKSDEFKEFQDKNIDSIFHNEIDVNSSNISENEGKSNDNISIILKYSDMASSKLIDTKNSRELNNIDQVIVSQNRTNIEIDSYGSNEKMMESTDTGYCPSTIISSNSATCNNEIHSININLSNYDMIVGKSKKKLIGCSELSGEMVVNNPNFTITDNFTKCEHTELNASEFMINKKISTKIDDYEYDDESITESNTSNVLNNIIERSPGNENQPITYRENNINIGLPHSDNLSIKDILINKIPDLVELSNNENDKYIYTIRTDLQSSSWSIPMIVEDEKINESSSLVLSDNETNKFIHLSCADIETTDSPKSDSSIANNDYLRNKNIHLVELQVNENDKYIHSACTNIETTVKTDLQNPCCSISSIEDKSINDELVSLHENDKYIHSIPIDKEANLSSDVQQSNCSISRNIEDKSINQANKYLKSIENDNKIYISSQISGTDL